MAITKVLNEIIEYRELLWNLTLRDIRIRYKQSFLGMAWALFQPLSLMVIFTFVFSKVARIDTANVPYPVFAYVGLVPWQLFSTGLMAATTSLVSNSSLVTKVYFPREVFPLAAIFSKLIDFLVSISVLFALMVYFEVSFHRTILLMPFVLIVQLTFMLGIGFILSMGNLFYRDVGYIMNVLILIWMFVTSVIYPIQTNNALAQRILLLNPMTPIINAYRDVLLYGRVLNIPEFAPAVAISLGTLLSGVLWFHKAEYLFAERI